MFLSFHPTIVTLAEHLLPLHFVIVAAYFLLCFMLSQQDLYPAATWERRSSPGSVADEGIMLVADLNDRNIICILLI